MGPEEGRSESTQHGITFEEAATAFGDPMSITIDDPDHSADEDRCVLIGRTGLMRLVVVIHVERGERNRIISARRANAFERRIYAGKEK